MSEPFCLCGFLKNEMRKILGLIICLLSLVDSANAQNQQATRFDSLIDGSIFMSEQALFEANFKEAENYVALSHFKEFRPFQDKHEMKLNIQNLRIQSFKNILYRQSIDREKTLNTLLDLRFIARNVKDKNILGDYYTLLSSSYRSTGISDSAFYFQNIALQFYKEAGNLKKVAQVRGSQISRRHNALLAAGETEKILQLIPEYEKEIEFGRKCDNKYVLAYNTRHLAQIYRRQTSNIEEAMRLFQMSLDLRKEIGFKLFLPASYSSIGDVALKMGKNEKAIEMYLQSIGLAEQIGFVRYQFYPRIMLGDIYEAKGDYEKAKKYYLKALKFASTSSYEEGIDEALEKLESLIN